MFPAVGTFYQLAILSSVHPVSGVLRKDDIQGRCNTIGAIFDSLIYKPVPHALFITYGGLGISKKGTLKGMLLQDSSAPLRVGCISLHFHSAVGGRFEECVKQCVRK